MHLGTGNAMAFTLKLMGFKKHEGEQQPNHAQRESKFYSRGGYMEVFLEEGRYWIRKRFFFPRTRIKRVQEKLIALRFEPGGALT